MSLLAAFSVENSAQEASNQPCSPRVHAEPPGQNRLPEGSLGKLAGKHLLMRTTNHCSPLPPPPSRRYKPLPDGIAKAFRRARSVGGRFECIRRALREGHLSGHGNDISSLSPNTSMLPSIGQALVGAFRLEQCRRGGPWKFGMVLSKIGKIHLI